MTDKFKQKLIELADRWNSEADEWNEWSEGLFQAATELRELISEQEELE